MRYMDEIPTIQSYEGGKTVPEQPGATTGYYLK